ncbi:MAG: ABC-F family ATP-binding cassette domain-containing protein [Sphingobacteriales bacterium]|nr:ABC-F family ATP-binding cassette domain-containing protein [Sphingobacteriales bacterium]
MIQIQNLSVQYGSRVLFDEINITIKTRDRVGLVGKNGAGKSTLLKIIAGWQSADSGSVQMPNHSRVGYLPQELALSSDKSVYEEAATAFDEIQLLEQELAETLEALHHITDYESKAYYKLLEDSAHLQERLQLLGSGAKMRAIVEKVLKGLGFVQADFERPCSEFSGGWRMRIELAKILLRQPDYLLLDEPTNHLDIESIMWLEAFLQDYNGAIILISHDQRFLDTVTRRTIEIVGGKIYDYPVSYTAFLELREARRERQITEKKQQDKYVEHTEMLINKFRAQKNKAAFAQSLITKLEKLERVEIDELETSRLTLRFPPAPRSGRTVVKTEQLQKSYETIQVLRGIDFELERGEKIAFVGKNGEGKTTLSKIIAGKENSKGLLEIGHNVSIGYFEQNQAESLDGNQTVFQVIDDAATGDMRAQVRSLLGAFLFSGEEVDKKVKVLSGGEKARLALAKLLLQPVNLLILDEPTNHLDIRSKSILKQAIQNFDGSVIVVSHDRDFLKDLTQKVYEFKNGQIKQFIGDIYSFLEQRNIQSLDELGLKSSIQAQAPAASAAANNNNNNIAAAPKLSFESEKELKKLRSKIGKTEQLITEKEAVLKKLEQQMGAADFYEQAATAEQVLRQYEAAKQEIELAMQQWEQLNTEAEALEKAG